MTLEHVGAFLAGVGVALIVVALLDRHTYRRPDRRPDRRPGLLTRRKWRDLPYVTKE